MDRVLEKYIDRINKYKAKGQAPKALEVVEEAVAAGWEGVDLEAQAVGLHFLLDSWKDALSYLHGALKKYPLMDLCKPNRETFLKLVHEYSGFRTTLTEYLMDTRNFNGVGGWVELSDEADRRWLIANWAQAAERAKGHHRYALLTSVGIGKFLSEKWEEAWRQWEDILVEEPDFLKSIMAFCHGSPQLDSQKFSHRLRLIRLIYAAGRHNETMSLLLTLGMESRQNALKVLTDIPDFMNDAVRQLPEALTLRFKLAIHLNDKEILLSIIDEMDNLDEDVLFTFRRQVIAQIDEADTKRQAMLRFCSLYIRKTAWENAALLLETLYEEAPDPGIVDMMQKVLEHYPVMSRLHFLVGKFHLNHGDKDIAYKHLTAIASVVEFKDVVRLLLEGHILLGYDHRFAKLLFRILKFDSHRAALVANLIIMHADMNEKQQLLDEWGVKLEKDAAGPFWFLLFVDSFCDLKQFERAYPLLCNCLAMYPDISSELVHSAEKICNKYRTDFTDIVELIEKRLNILKPLKAWTALHKHFIEATQKYLAKRVSDARIEHGDEAIPDRKQGGKVPELTGFFKEFVQHLHTGRRFDAVETIMTTLKKYPKQPAAILNHFQKIALGMVPEPMWTKIYLDVLLQSGEYDLVIEAGKQAINDADLQEELPEIYQHMATAYEKSGRDAEALRFYCLSSRQSKFYEENRESLKSMVFPKNPHLLKEVVNLALINEDQEVWEHLTKAWFEFRPEDLPHLISAQSAFADQVGTPRALLDLAQWYLQAGRLDEIGDILNQIDLRDSDIKDSLIHIANLVNLKNPEDPKPKFMLGKYYMAQQDIPKAVDTFRTLAETIPKSAESIYHYLRNYLKNHPDGASTVYLYGFLIRIALDYGFYLASVKLLDEFGKRDQDAAESLSGGVLRVLQKKEDNLEALYEFAVVMAKWGDMNRMLKINEDNTFGTHMAQERLGWFESCSDYPDLNDRANLAAAGLLFEMREFERSREALGAIEDHAFRGKALELYERLAVRFPKDLGLWEEAGWAAFPGSMEKAAHFFKPVYDQTDGEAKLAAFAVLAEAGQAPPMESLLPNYDTEDAMYKAVGTMYHRLREIEIAYVEEHGGEASEKGLEYLIQQGELDRYHTILSQAENLDDPARARLAARLHLHQGNPNAAAWALEDHKLPAELKQSFFFNTDLLERAILNKTPGTRLPLFIRQAFLKEHGRPKSIQAPVSLIRNMHHTDRH